MTEYLTIPYFLRRLPMNNKELASYLVENMSDINCNTSPEYLVERILDHHTKGTADAALALLLKNSTPKFTVENLRQLYCMTFEEFQEVFGFGGSGGYALGKFGTCSGDLFKFLADLDNGNQRKLFNHFNGE